MQTSIETLIDSLEEVILTEQESKILAPLFEHVKKRHKQEIIDAVNEGIKEGYSDYIDTEWGREHDYNPEQYYQETFKKD